MKITIENLQRTVSINPARIIRAAKKTLLYKKVKRVRLSIVFVTDQRIKALNKKYLNREYATDVLAFDLLTVVPPKSQLTRKQPSRYWPSTMSVEKKRPIREAPLKSTEVSGEIIISAATAKKNSQYFHSTIDRELALYVVHGILHLLGFDDHSKRDQKRMRQEEHKILKVTGYDR